MAISFVSPSYRAASSDLTIAISPLGLVELADEEFEVHGPRLNRYASNWAFYLGHHWSYRREIGEPQPVFNWCEAFSDFLTNFCLTGGVNFKSPKVTEAIVPQMLDTIWEEHQPMGKDALLWEILQQGCTVPEAEALTPEGWKNLYELEAHPDLPIATLNPETGDFEWQPFSLNVFAHDGPLVRYKGQRVDHLLTPGHDVWVQQSKTYTVRGGKRWDHGSKWRKRKAAETSGPTWTFRGGADRFDGSLVMPTIPASRQKPEYVFPSPEAMVRFIGWWVAEGSVSDSGQIGLGQSLQKNPYQYTEIRGLLHELGIANRVTPARDKFGRPHQMLVCNVGVARWLIKEFGQRDKERRLPAWVKELPEALLDLLLKTLRKGDGDTGGERTWRYSTVSQRLADDVQEIAIKLGYLTQVSSEERLSPQQTMWRVHVDPRGLMSVPRSTQEHYTGEVWCPTVANGLWFMRMNGRAVVTGNSVSGDCFIKVAFDPAFTDPAGFEHPSKIRILPMNSAFCFPEFHPHDMTRMIRFKMKYRFWGCHRTDVEALTRRGWKFHDEILPDDELLTIDPVTDEIHWGPVRSVNVYDYDGEMIEWRGRVNASATPNHRWLGELPSGERKTIHGEFVSHDTPVKTRLVVGGGTPLAFVDQPKWSDELVETVGWYLTEGLEHYNQTGFHTIRISQHKDSPYIGELRRLAAYWKAEGLTCNEWKPTSKGMIDFYCGKGLNAVLADVAPQKQLTPEFISSLTHGQAVLLRSVLLAGDGNIRRGSVRWTQIDEGRKDGYQMLCAMLGTRTTQEASGEKVQELQSRYIGSRYLNEERVHYKGQVWCPVVDTGYFMARRQGNTYWTGNTALEGTRQVFSYTELWTEQAMQSFINDELVEDQENPLGRIPFVHIANRKVPSSPWGLSDIQDITDLNRIYNETMTLLLDIVNYYASPTTIIMGAKSSNLERGPKKVWAVPNEKAKVENLTLGAELGEALKLVELIKEKMHEIVGVPIGVLGQDQQISNTSGVALQLQYLPLMQKFRQKTTQYASGLVRLNELLILVAAVYKPEMLELDETRDPPLEEGQLTVLDPEDPLTLRNTVEFGSPLPLDMLLLLNEAAMKMQMGLESKEGALRLMGEPNPAEKLQELMDELHQDMLEQTSLDLVRAQGQMMIAMLTGVPPEGAEPTQSGPAAQPAGGVPSAGGPGVSSAPGAQPTGVGGQPFADDPDVQEILQKFSTLSAGTKIPQLRNPLKGGDDD
jgi:hypothetical protein